MAASLLIGALSNAVAISVVVYVLLRPLVILSIVLRRPCQRSVSVRIHTRLGSRMRDDHKSPFDSWYSKSW
eukprot:8342710-Prorocentrum_lima.AAC.1